MIRITFLGTAASRPTVGRNVSSLVVNREGELFMFDCGEGTQRQMMRFGTGFSVNDFFFTHLHADHFLGLIGLLRTMGLQGREEPARLWCPENGGRILREAVHLGVERVPFDIEINEMEPWSAVERPDFEIRAYPTRHSTRSLGYALIEHERRGRFDPDTARRLGVPEGPLFGRLHRGQPVEVNGRTIDPGDVVGPARRGRRVVYTGDTRPCRETVEIAHDADVLIHEATFADEEAERARWTRHSTASEAARVAREAGVKALYMTHLSSRYAENPRTLEREARRVHRSSKAAYDGLDVEVAYPPDEEANA